MEIPEKTDIDRFFEARREEGRADRRRLEKQVGAGLLVCSLFMTVIFLVALRFSAGNPGFMAAPIFFLLVAVGLFARGLWDILYGRTR